MPRTILRLAEIILLGWAATATAQDATCELEAYAKAKAFQEKWNTYIRIRTDINSQKMRDDLRKRFDAVMACACF